jgi:hypothetical protein
LALQARRDPEFDARWAAWVARAPPDDRRLRRRLAFAAPFAVVAVVTLADVLFVR